MSDKYEFEEVVDEMSGEKVEVGSQATGDKRAESDGSDNVEVKDEAEIEGTMTDCE